MKLAMCFSVFSISGRMHIIYYVLRRHWGTKNVIFIPLREGSGGESIKTTECEESHRRFYLGKVYF